MKKVIVNSNIIETIITEKSFFRCIGGLVTINCYLPVCRIIDNFILRNRSVAVAAFKGNFNCNLLVSCSRFGHSFRIDNLFHLKFAGNTERRQLVGGIVIYNQCVVILSLGKTFGIN